jgi:hypothetical protein
VAASPLLFLQMAFIGDPDGWFVAFRYGAFSATVVLVMIGWCGYTFIEYRWRVRKGESSDPLYGAISAPLLLTFFVPSIVVSPLVRQMPQLCRVTQSINWTTSVPNPQWASNHSFVLVLSGSGTTEDYCFTHGFMNWTGDESAGLTSVDFSPISFQYDYYEPSHPGSLEVLRKRMSAANIPKDELDVLSAEIWNLLQRVNQRNTVGSTSGVVDDIYCEVDGEWDFVIGGVIWMVIVFFAFQIVGLLTIKRSEPSVER